MEPFNPSRRVIRFAVFEVDLSAGELRKNGRKLKLQEQPFQVLASLLDRPGEVVTREELRERLWPGDTYVDFDRSLNSAVNRLREALDDSANQPRFVETLPRRGYRFVAPLERHDRVGDLSSPIPHAAETVKTPTGQTLQARLRRARLQQVVLLAAFVGAIGVIVALWLREPTAVVDAPFRRFGLPVRSARPFPVAPEISPDARHVVYTDILGSGRSLWIQDLGRTEPRELAGTDDAYRPFWSPDGGFIGFAAGLELKKIPVDGGAPISLCRIPSANFFGGGGALGALTVARLSSAQGSRLGSTRSPPGAEPPAFCSSQRIQKKACPSSSHISCHYLERKGPCCLRADWDKTARWRYATY